MIALLSLAWADCEAKWASPRAEYLLSAFEDLAHMPEMWPAYQADEASHVLDAGDGCVALWKNQKVTKTQLPNPPRLLTPMFGYALPWTATEGAFGALLEATAQPDALTAWLVSLGVDRAVVTPIQVAPPLGDFIDEIAALQIAMHEAFHVDVMLPRWAGEETSWPAWEEQPDRAALKSCYPDAEAVQFEQQALADAVEQAYLEGDIGCDRLNYFRILRAKRYDKVKNIKIVSPDGVLTCPEAELRMELEEGVPDCVSWFGLLAMEKVEWERVDRRNRSRMDEPFYAFGAMQAALAGPMEKSLLVNSDAPTGLGDVIAGLCAG